MIEPTTFLDGRVTLYAGDCTKVLRKLPANSVDSVVCDPPYNLTSITKRFGEEGAKAPKSKGKSGVYKRAAPGFMGKKWDSDIAFKPAVWHQVKRVLKPGGYLLAFASTRGYGRMQVAIERAGFITHPMIAWIFGSGFPKATRIQAPGYEDFRYGGQVLKPAIEPIYMGQKPFEKGLSGTENILKHGTGAVNIDGCRISGGGEVKPRGSSKLDTDMHEGWARPWMEDRAEVQRRHDAAIDRANNLGRWPANVIHDGSDEVMAAFPDAGGQQRSVGPDNGEKASVHVYGDYGARDQFDPRDDSGSAARFFYSAKADVEDRIGSKHPTVKPLDLKQYLCRLITPPGGVILDPFAGTGTTGEAAFREGFRAILIEMMPEYQADIAKRMDLAAKPTKRAAVVAAARNKTTIKGAEGTPLFGDAG